MESRFTKRDWVKLPFVVVLRLPVYLLMATLEWTGLLLTTLSKSVYTLMCKLPEVRYRQEYIDEQRAKAMKERLDTLNERNQIS